MQTPSKQNVSGLIQPQAVPVEEAVLGAMLLEKPAVSEVLTILFNRAIFYNEKNALVYDAIQALYERREAVDLLTVTNEMRAAGTLEEAGGAYYVTQLTTKVNSAVNLEFHCRILMEKFMRRLLIQVSSYNLKVAYDESVDIFETLDNAQTKLLKLREALQTRKASNGQEILLETLKLIEEASQKDGNITGVRSGLKVVDQVTAGWQNSDLIIIAGRPGMGKTALSLKLLRNAVVNDNPELIVPTVFFSREMSRTQLMTRLIASEAHIPNSSLRKGKLEEWEWAQLHEKTSRTINSRHLHIDDTAKTLSEIRAKSISMAARYGIKMIIVDYLQLVHVPKGGTREQEIGAISSGLKDLAKELDIPVIALSQLSRAVESRPDKRPMLSDLRESGSIEQDADIVIFTYRPAYYKIMVDEAGNSLENVCDLIFAKHRNGAIPTVTVGCDMKYSDMFDLPDRTEDFTPAPDGYNPNKFTQPNKEEEEPWSSSGM